MTSGTLSENVLVAARHIAVCRGPISEISRDAVYWRGTTSEVN